MSTKIIFPQGLFLTPHSIIEHLSIGDEDMWMTSIRAVNGPSAGLLLAATASYQSLNVRLPQLNRTLGRARDTLASDQADLTKNSLEESELLATHVLNPSTADWEALETYHALLHWYENEFVPYKRVFDRLSHKRIIIQEKLLQGLDDVIAEFRRKVFIKPYSDPPEYIGTLYRDPAKSPTVPSIGARRVQDEVAAILARDTFRKAHQAESVTLTWQEDKADGAKTHKSSQRNAAFCNVVEEALARHTGKNLIIEVEQDAAAVQGLALIVLLSLKKKLPESKHWLFSRHIDLVPKNRRGAWRISYDLDTDKFQLSPIPS